MELVNISFLGNPQTGQTYNPRDKKLITTTTVNAAFGQPDDYIEYFIYDLNNELLYRNYRNIDFTIGSDVNPVNGLTTAISIDPEKDIKNAGYDRGSVVVEYNFLRKGLSSEVARQFWIKEISTSRREIKAARQDLSNTDLSTAFDAFGASLTSDNYYPDFYLNFGDNDQVIGVNVAYIEEGGVGYILFKLYEPLPIEYDIKSEFWVVQKIAETVRYQVDIQVEAEQIAEQFNLRGPNFDIDVLESVAQTTPYYNYSGLLSTNLTSSLQQLKSYLDDEAVGINVDFSDFTNFIHFSSATERVYNFVYKLRLIEQYETSIASLNSLAPGQTTNTIVSSSKTTLQTNINNLIAKFDPYEYYLYFSSASTAWPKSDNLAPYTLYSTTSSQALAWLGSTTTEPTTTSLSILYSASLYDNTNSDGLRYTAPTYIRDDESNEPYLVFLDMIGQHFDNIWLYYKDVTNRYSAENNPNIGISLDLVAEALKGFGMHLYTNTNLSDNIYYSLFGINDNGSTLPLTSSQYAQINLASSSLLPLAGQPYLSQSIYLPPFGNEKLNEYVTVFTTPSASVTASFDQLSPTQLEQETYKRLYHNLPYILKTKGTERGIRALIACYGIPNSILTVNEYGGHSIYDEYDIQGIQDNKIYTGSVLELTDKQLSPFTTIQVYDNDRSKNSPNIEIAFTPADSINADITSSLPNLRVQQLIGNPSLQYSSSYEPLVQTADAYFKANYTKGYNVWDFIRVIKFYNNSLFKMLKDFVPARTSLASGIVIKSHMLERNKYERHEPTVTTSSYSDDIRMVSVSGSDPDEIKYSTAHITYVSTPSGSIPVDNIYSAEKYTGEFGGTTVTVTDGQAFNQSDYLIDLDEGVLFTEDGDILIAENLQILTGPIGNVVGQEVNYGAIFQNISSSVKSTRFLDLDYSTNVVTPVNYGLITKSIDEGPLASNDPYAPFAQLQDYNYSLRRSLLPRYEGSKTRSKFYNTYTSASSGYEGDSSYGLSAAVDRNSTKLGWVKNIPVKSLNFYYKTTITLKYLVAEDASLVELNLRNNNLTDVQRTFKSGERAIVSISDINKPSLQKTLDGSKLIFRGGFSYDPILFRERGETLSFLYTGTAITTSIGFGIRAFDQRYYAYAYDALLTGGWDGYVTRNGPSTSFPNQDIRENTTISGVGTGVTINYNPLWTNWKTLDWTSNQRLQWRDYSSGLPLRLPRTTTGGGTYPFFNQNIYRWSKDTPFDGTGKQTANMGFFYLMPAYTFLQNSITPTAAASIFNGVGNIDNPISGVEYEVYGDKRNFLSPTVETGAPNLLSITESPALKSTSPTVRDRIKNRLSTRKPPLNIKTNQTLPQVSLKARSIHFHIHDLLMPLANVNTPFFAGGGGRNSGFLNSVYDFVNGGGASPTVPAFVNSALQIYWADAGAPNFGITPLSALQWSSAAPYTIVESLGPIVQAFNLPLAADTTDPGFITFQNPQDAIPKIGEIPLYKIAETGTYEVRANIQLAMNGSTKIKFPGTAILNSVSNLKARYSSLNSPYTYNYVYGFNIKAFCVILKEKAQNKAVTSADLDNLVDWEYVASTEIRDYVNIQNCTNVRTDYNLIRVDGGPPPTADAAYTGPGGYGTWCASSTNVIPAFVPPRVLNLGDSWDWAFTCNMRVVGEDGVSDFTKVDLKKGDRLRMVFILVDLDRMMWPTANNLNFIIGKSPDPATVAGADGPWKSEIPNSETTVFTETNRTKTFIEIQDPLQATVTTTVSGSVQNTVFTTTGSFLITAPGLTNFTVTQSTFLPDSSSAQFYTPVIDDFAIQKGDLIRIGAFKDPRATYHEVLTTGTTASLSGFDKTDEYLPKFCPQSIVELDNAGWTAKANCIIIQNTPDSRNFTDIVWATTDREFTTTGLDQTSVSLLGSNENRKFKLYKQPYIISQYGATPNIILASWIVLEVSPRYVTGDTTPQATFFAPYPMNPTGPQIDVGRVILYKDPTCTTAAPNWCTRWSDLNIYNVRFTGTALASGIQYKLQVTPSFPTSSRDLSYAFAILRPKPDETTVIVEHKKEDGEVAQSILIPEDIATRIRANIGDLYRTLNPEIGGG